MKSSPKLPVYTGPAISSTLNYKEALRAAGPAPKGWQYLKVGDTITEETIALNRDRWEKARAVGESIRPYYFCPRAVPVKRARKPRSVYFCSPSNDKWVGKISGGVEFEYGEGGRTDTTNPLVLVCVTNGLASGTYKRLTRAEFLAALKKFKVKEGGTKIVPAPDYKAENASPKVPETKKLSATKVSAEVQTLLAKTKMLEDAIATAQAELDKIKETIRGLT